LSGDKPWCSGATSLDRALITAHTPAGRRLFAIDLTSPTVGALPSSWVARGLAEVDSTGIHLDGTPALPVGEAGWYLERPGFAWGGLGVAACWFGGLVGIARRLWDATENREPDQIALMQLGTVDLQVQRCVVMLAAAALAVDSGDAEGDAGVLWAERVRGTVADAVEQVLSIVGHATGPAPLTLEDEHARRVADLTVYVRQHHGERDTARLGSLLRRREHRPW
jgi:alkylation response protein AidB-like acyl-CoA dehydrogenase